MSDDFTTCYLSVTVGFFYLFSILNVKKLFSVLNFFGCHLVRFLCSWPFMPPGFSRTELGGSQPISGSCLPEYVGLIVKPFFFNQWFFFFLPLKSMSSGRAVLKRLIYNSAVCLMALA